MNLPLIWSEVDQYEEELTLLRRDFHRYAESAWTEFRTTAKIVTFLRAHGLEAVFGREVIHPEYAWAHPGQEILGQHKKRAAEQGADPRLIEQMQDYTGAMAVIETGRPGPVIALRFDIDCNDVGEDCSESHRPYREGFSSVNPGVMHACGHDGHTAIGLVTAAVLAAHREELCGTMKLLFQPGEEGDRGALSMVKKGLLDDVDVVLAAHIYPAPAGMIGLAGTQTGLYATTKFDVTVHGKSAHAGGAPQDGNHAINAACLAVAGMHAFLQDGRGCSRLNVGTIEGGTGRNVIPDRCLMRLETRGSNTEVEQRLYHAALGTVDGVCKMFGCTFTSEVKGICPTGDGDLDLAGELARAAAEVPDFQYTQTELKQTGGTDDFSCMMDAVRAHGGKACYMGLLTPLAAGHHNSCFDFDERILKAGVKAFLTAVDVLQKKEEFHR